MRNRNNYYKPIRYLFNILEFQNYGRKSQILFTNLGYFKKYVRTRSMWDSKVCNLREYDFTSLQCFKNPFGQALTLFTTS